MAAPSQLGRFVASGTFRRKGAALGVFRDRRLPPPAAGGGGLAIWPSGSGEGPTWQEGKWQNGGVPGLFTLLSPFWVQLELLVAIGRKVVTRARPEVPTAPRNRRLAGKDGSHLTRRPQAATFSAFSSPRSRWPGSHWPGSHWSPRAAGLERSAPHCSPSRRRPHAAGGPPACPDAETDTDETVGTSSSQVLPGVRVIFVPFGSAKIAGWVTRGASPGTSQLHPVAEDPRRPGPGQVSSFSWAPVSSST